MCICLLSMYVCACTCVECVYMNVGEGGGISVSLTSSLMGDSSLPSPQIKGPVCLSLEMVTVFWLHPWMTRSDC